VSCDYENRPILEHQVGEQSQSLFVHPVFPVVDVEITREMQHVHHHGAKVNVGGTHGAISVGSAHFIAEGDLEIIQSDVTVAFVEVVEEPAKKASKSTCPFDGQDEQNRRDETNENVNTQIERTGTRLYHEVTPLTRESP